MKKTNKKGFTIVELVIVIAVIAILAAVLIPTFSGVIEAANQSSAMSAAKNAYTEWLSTDKNATKLSENTDFYIKSGEYYFAVENGQFNSTGSKTAPTSGTTILYVEGSELTATTGNVIVVADNGAVSTTATTAPEATTAEEEP